MAALWDVNGITTAKFTKGYTWIFVQVRCRSLNPREPLRDEKNAALKGNCERTFGTNKSLKSENLAPDISPASDKAPVFDMMSST